MGDIEVGIDEKIENTAKKSGFRFKNVEELSQLLTEKCLIKAGDTDDEYYFLMMTGAAAEKDFDENTVQEQAGHNTVGGFSIIGERLKIPVEKGLIEKDKEIFFANKLINKTERYPDGALRLAKGKLKFLPYSETERIRSLAAGSMARILQDKGSYLKQWDEYGAVEGELLLARAKAVAKIEYTQTEQTAKGVKFFIKGSIPSELTDDDSLEITTEEPSYLKNTGLSWNEYSAELELEFKTKTKEFNDDKTEVISAKIVNIESSSIELALESPPAEDHFLVLSINGDTTQVKRRMTARQLICEGRSANPLLGLLIEEGGEIPPIKNVKVIKGLTPFVEGKVFPKHPPNITQKTAIEKALNTPDIFLIQGPPGTGKTTVITAILERLNEEQDKTSSIRGKILVSGFQHDAVENIISRLSINSLPAVKFGVRSGATDDVVSNKISLWCQDVADKIRAKNPQIKESEAQRRLAELFTIYSISPSISNARGLLNLVIELPRNILSQELCDKTAQLIDTLNFNADIEQTDTAVLELIRSLRISEEGFLDDGKERASDVDVSTELEHQLQPDDKAVLKKAIIWKEGRDFDFLPALKSLKLKLLDLYSPRPQFRVEKPREDILALIAQVSKQFQAYQSRANKTDSILADFLHELEDNPNGVRESIEDYNFVFAATTQQAAGKLIQLAKTKDKEESVKYDTVIIDEAARVSPRDLLIPMAQAEKRIILVGDHRQLPHIIDEAVVKDLDSSEEDFVKISMFQYLFERLKKLEKADGVCRTVTLDAQYRTHPLLGNFVSDNFYKQYGEAYDSPLPAKLFNHDLKDAEGYAAAWLDIPNSKGKEDRNSSKSRYRVPEAKAIAKRLKEWIDSDAGKNLTFGVISFYKAQVDAVFEELRHFGITQKSSEGLWEIVAEYKYIEKIEDGKKITEERLRIGTVDSFQGMEFDVVFLSMVRTQNMDKLPQNIKNETDQKTKAGLLFGHLMSENRLCVSMSRQKKILVVVGDSELVKTEIGSKYVPALGNYFDLCKEHGVIL